MKGQILSKLSNWGHFFRIEFDITVHALPSGEWSNVLHFTQSENGAEYGDRIPAIFVYNQGFFHICSAVSGDKNHCINFNFTLNVKYHLVIRQFENHDQKVIYEIEVNNEVVHSIPNEQSRDFPLVMIYASDPWYGSFISDYGVVEKLRTSSSGVYICIFLTHQKFKHVVLHQNNIC